MEKATFGGGCFWGVEAAYRLITGVKATEVGYEGGDLDNPSYEDVCTDRTGHSTPTRSPTRSCSTSSGPTTIRRSSTARVPTSADSIAP